MKHASATTKTILTSQAKRSFIFGRLFKKSKVQTTDGTDQSQDQNAVQNNTKPFNDGIYNYDIFSIERKERELLEKYPDQHARIKKALEIDDSILKKKKEHEMTVDEIGLYRAQLQKEKAVKIY